MEEYKAPKLRLKNRKKMEVKVKGKKESPFQAPIGSGKTIRIKGKKKVKANIMDRRAMTKETASELMETERMNSEMDYQKIIKNMK